MKQTSFVISFASLVATGSAMPGLVDRQATGFNPSTQAVSVTGSNAWQAPGSSDMRGPCPGLNAMANHGYIPRNGFVSIEQVVQGMYDTYGMGKMIPNGASVADGQRVVLTKTQVRTLALPLLSLRLSRRAMAPHSRLEALHQRTSLLVVCLDNLSAYPTPTTGSRVTPASPGTTCTYRMSDQV